MDEYLLKLTGNQTDQKNPVRRACMYAWDIQAKENELPSSLDVALILSELGADETTLIVTLLSDSRLRDEAFFSKIGDEFNDDIKQMVKNQIHLF